MSSRGRGSFSNKGRGRGYAGSIIAQHGKKKLIAEKVIDPDYEEFLAFKASKEANKAQSSNTASSSQSYAQVIQEQEDELSSFVPSYSREVILLLDPKEIRRDVDPWNLMDKYFSESFFTSLAYKQRIHFEHILKITESCEITHFHTGNNQQNYSFSKVTIKQIISVNEWGTSPFREKEYIHPTAKTPVKYNYWDYVESFYKAFYYENNKRKHSWFFKICSNVFKREIPIWFFQWWATFGPNIKILPEPFLGLFDNWTEVSPKLAENQDDCIEGMAPLCFFAEFSIPWIWKWDVQVGHTALQIPALYRVFYTKFWKKMLIKDKNGVLESQETIDKIKSTIEDYRVREKYSQKKTTGFYEQIAKKVRSVKGRLVSDKEILDSYIQEIKNDFRKYARSTRASDSSMAEISDDKDFTVEDILAGESQDPDDEFIENIDLEKIDNFLDHLKDTVDKIPRKDKGKEKALTSE